MGVDTLRSCYETTMRFFTDDPLEIPVRWFFCAPNAQVLPFPTKFASGNWASSRLDWGGVGEVLGADRPWVDGSKPPFDGSRVPGFDGDHFAGPEAVFRNGVAYPGVPIETRDDGLCLACGRLPLSCAEFRATYANVFLRITAVSTHSPFVFGHVGDVFTLGAVVDCTYRDFPIVVPHLSDPLSLVFVYGSANAMLVAEVAFAGSVSLFDPTPTLFPSYIARYVGVPMWQVFNDPHYFDEVWDVEITVV